jgi:hypothetical protein
MLRVDEPLRHHPGQQRQVERAHHPCRALVDGGVEVVEQRGQPEARSLLGVGDGLADLGRVVELGEHLEAGGPQRPVGVEELDHAGPDGLEPLHRGGVGIAVGGQGTPELVGPFPDRLDAGRVEQGLLGPEVVADGGQADP